MSIRNLMTAAFGVVASLLAIGLCQAQTELIVTSEALVRPLRTESGMVAGDIHALVLDPDLGSVRMVVIDLAGPPRRAVAIPWSSLAVRRDGSFWLTITEDELLRAPSYPFRSTSSSDRVYTVVSEPTYAPSDAGTVTFNPGRVISYRGRVVGTMTAPLQGGVDVVVAVIDVGAEEIHADLGAQFYLEQIGCDIEPGESVVIEGFLSEDDGRTLVVVSRISVQDRTFVLRNSDGSPRWK